MFDLLAGLGIGIPVAITPVNLALCVVGCIAGNLLGALPSMGAAAIIGLLFPAVAALSPVGSLVLLASVHVGAATAAIRRDDRAFRGAAIMIALTTAAMIVVALLVPPVARLVQPFSPAAYAALIVLALALSAALSRGSVMKALALVVVGVILAALSSYAQGIDTSFAAIDLSNGIEPAVLAIGLLVFATQARRWRAPIKNTDSRDGDRAIGIVAVRSAVSRLAYLPLLSVGLPLSGSTALMVAALSVHGLAAGPQLAQRQPGLVWGAVIALLIAGIILFLLDWPFAAIRNRIGRTPARLAVPTFMVVGAICTYALNQSPTDVIMAALFGCLGYVLLGFGFDLRPMLVGFVLGKILDEKVRQGLTTSRGSFATLVEQPLSASLLLVAVVVLAVAFLPSIRRSRDTVFTE